MSSGRDAATPSLDHRSVDWDAVDRVAFSVHQHFTYEYPGPIADLRQRLIVVPPAAHGDQRLCSYRIEADVPESARDEGTDAFGNHRTTLHIPSVERRVVFSVTVNVERGGVSLQPVVRDDALQPYLHSTKLTEADPALRRAAREIGRRLTGHAEDRALTIARWVHAQMAYMHDLTGVHTTAAEAFALRGGVCQDYAHVMLVLCRLNGIPARYVSGHLLGEGGTHAWVEVLAPADRPGTSMALAFDPTHGRVAGLGYITVATGRDYADVPPTSGSFTAPYGGVLTAGKQASILSLQFHPEADPAQQRGAA